MSEAAVGYAFEQLEPSQPPPRDAASRLLAEAGAQADEIREQARAAGHAEGFAAGLAEGRAQVAASLSALQEAIAGVGELRARTAETVEREAIELAIALAGKVVAGSLQARPELVVEVVQGALRRVAGQRSVSVLVNPEDLEVVRAALGEPDAAAGERRDLQGDQRVGRGGAIVRSVEGEVDARVTTQLERAREVVAAELGEGERAP